MEEFDYYIYIDYSDYLIGYIVVEKNKIRELLNKTKRFRHFKDVKHDSAYISAIKRRIKKENIFNLLLKHKIKNVKMNIELFAEIIEFLIKNFNNTILVSIDDNFYISFTKLFGLIKNKENLKLIRESKIKKYSLEYQLNLIIDNLVNIERRKLK